MPVDEIGAALIAAQEQERRRIARELHDGPMQRLVAVLMMIEIYERLQAVQPDLAKDELSKVKESLKRAVADLRQLLSDLKPLVLEESGLAPAVQALVNEFGQRTSVTAMLEIQGEPRRVGYEIEVAIYRSMQEALNNAAKHAAATSVLITLELGENVWGATIQDNGLGFDLNTVRERGSKGDLPISGGFGLRGIAERIQAVGGRLRLDSTPGEGTVVRFEVPLS